MTTRRRTLLERLVLGYLIVGAGALCVAAVLAPIALIAYVVVALR